MEKFIKNIKNLLSLWPEEILPDRKKEMSDILQELKDNDNNEDVLKKRAIIIGKESYPYLHAYYEIYNECCRVKEELGIHKYLKDENQQARFKKFLEDGGDVEKIRQGQVEEIYLTLEDVEAFRQAEAQVHSSVHREVAARIEEGDKAKFLELVKEGKEHLDLIDRKILGLRNLATQNEEWSGEIFSKISELEERWVNFANEPTEEDLNELLDYFNSISV